MKMQNVAVKSHSYMQLYGIEIRKNKEPMQREPKERGFWSYLGLVNEIMASYH